MPKTIDEINAKIEKGTVRVVRADEMTRIVRELGPERAASDVDVVTTGTFGAMCSSGVWLNFGHADPPIKMTRVSLNGVEAYAGAAAVDAYLGATKPSSAAGYRYGGAHVIEDLLRGREVVLRAVSYGTDCYPRKSISARIRLEDLNFAVMSNPRNGYQRYNAAANSGARTLKTYMGTLLPRAANVTYSGAGELSPLMNDPELRTIGAGTRIFLGGAAGLVTGAGSQHNPEARFATLMVQGDLKAMSPEFIRAAVFDGYGCTLYVGLGLPIPVLDAEIAARTGISDAEIETDVLDYGVPSRSRPSLGRTTYAELKSGAVEIAGRRARTSPLSSFARALRVADVLKSWIQKGSFRLSAPVEPLPRRAVLKGLEAFPSRGAGPSRRGRAPNRRSKTRPTDGQRVGRDDQACIQCGHCLSFCPGTVFVRDERWSIRLRDGACRRCGACENACPVGALRLQEVRP
jgi:uncharacterized protein (DUF39 family)/ferredoxin